jgi:hypothetical protein
LGDSGDKNLIAFYKELFTSDDSYLVQAEILKSIGKTGDTSQVSYVENVTAMDSPRDVIKKAGNWAAAELQK